MTQAEMFKRLGAPLTNSRWSWGGVRTEDGAVFLRVWQDRKKKHGDRWYMMVTHHRKYENDRDNLGYKERNDHVALIRSGAPCFMVMCCAEDKSSSPRKIKSFNREEVFAGGDVIELDGDTWVEMAGRHPAISLTP
ncbi:hypothetical protein DZG01_15065 [Pseudomonas fluorescens]|nr:hypothetical protein DZG01_15065 [Pseudomonas fluorescens]